MSKWSFSIPFRIRNVDARKIIQKSNIGIFIFIRRHSGNASHFWPQFESVLQARFLTFRHVTFLFSRNLFTFLQYSIVYFPILPLFNSWDIVEIKWPFLFLYSDCFPIFCCGKEHCPLQRQHLLPALAECQRTSSRKPQHSFPHGRFCHFTVQHTANFYFCDV
jgi:hypothetical protein